MQPRYIYVTGVDIGAIDDDSVMASARYRMLIPGRALRDLGERVEVWSLARVSEVPPIGPGDRVTVMQIKSDSKQNAERRSRYRAILSAARSRAGCLRFDISNFTSNFDELDRRTIAAADVVSVPGEGLRQVLETALGPALAEKLAIIEDAYELDRAEPRFSPEPARVRALWFGFPSAEHQAALTATIRLLEENSPVEIDLHLVSSQELKQYCAQALAPLRRVRLTWTAWSVYATRHALAECDVVLLPGDDSPAMRAKSHNRLVESLRAGRYALCSPLPAYRELADYCHVGDIVDGLGWALAHPEEALRRVRAGQEAIEARFSPARLAAKWIELSTGARGAA